MTGRRSERLQRHHQARSGNLPRLDRIANCYRLVATPRVARARKALLQHLPNKHLGIEPPIDVTVCQPVFGCIGPAGQHCRDMHMAVDEARQNGVAR